MISFLEYSNNLENISNSLNRLANDEYVNVNDLMNDFLKLIPVNYIRNLTDSSKHNAVKVIRKILLYKNNAWNKLKSYVEVLWDEFINGPAKTLGNDLLNWISAKAMKDSNSNFFISYSGEMSKGTVFHYTQEQVRVFISKRKFTWKPYEELYSSILEEYTQKTFNYIKKLEKLV